MTGESKDTKENSSEYGTKLLTEQDEALQKDTWNETTDSKINKKEVYIKKCQDKQYSNALPNITNFEDIQQLVGTKGRWNLFLLLLCSYSSFDTAMYKLSYQFLGATPDHWCRFDSLLQANWTQEQIVSFAIPVNKKGKYESCLMYDRNYTRAVELGYQDATAALRDNPAVVPCHARDFNRSQYQSTLTTEFDLVCERRALYSSLNGAVQTGPIIACIVVGYIADRYGRRKVMLCCSVVSILSGLVAALSPLVEVYIFLMVVTLTGVTGLYISSFTLLMETCGRKERSSIGVLFVIPWSLGYMIVPGIAYLIRPWKWLLVALSLPSLPLLLNFWLLPESPRWLILQGKHKEALKVLKSAAMVNGKTLPSEERLLATMQLLQTKVSAEGKASVPKESVAKSKRRPAADRVVEVVKEYLVIVMVKELRGRAFIVFFCCADPYLYIFLGGLLELPSYLLLWPLTACLGRVKALLLLYLLCAIAILILALLMFFYPTAPIGILMLFSLSGKVAITMGFHLLWVFTVELFPTNYRSLATSQASLCARIGGVFSPYIIDLVGEVIVWAPSAVFCALSLLAAGLTIFLPETRGHNLLDVNTFHSTQTVKTSQRIHIRH
ncbi:hypothetical protein O3P69_002367 [Scylla paramamosain]|uniref:Major facilitator superfamily (MFS) profile domain-containing protein n=1 Tax=Scylla paramamosain TaxID=85552 RepID=A0AAW0V621_SCYPA